MSQIKAGVVLSYISILIINVVGLFTTPIIVRTLGVESYGIYLLLSSYIAYIALLDLGITATINRFIAKYRALDDKNQEIEFISIIIKFISLVILLVLFLGFILSENIDSIISSSYLSLTKLKIIIWALVLTLVLNIMIGFVSGYLAAYEKFIFIKSIEIVKSLLRVFLLLLVFSGKGDILLLVSIDFFTAFLIFLSSMFYFFKTKDIPIKFLLYNKVRFEEILSYSVWIFIFNAISQIQWRSGQIIIGYRLDPSAVAVYGIGIVLGTYYGAFSTAITSIFISRTTYKVYQNNDMKELTLYMVRVARMSALVLMLVLANFIVIGKDFIFLWVGVEFRPAWIIALVVMITYTVPLLQGIANQVLEAKKLFRFKSKVYLVCLTVGITFGYLLIDYYGINGMIIGIIFGWISAIVIMTIYYHVTLKLNMIDLFNGVSKIFLITVIVAVTGYSLNVIETDISWIIISIKAVIVSFIYLILIYRYALLDSEKSLVNKIRGKNLG